MEEFQVVHDFDPVPGAKSEHVRLVEVSVPGTNHIGCPGQRCVDHRIIIRVVEHDRGPLRRS